MTSVCSRSRRENHLTMAERRARNRSLSSLLCTPPPYPGYSACLGSISRISSTGHTTFLPYGDSLSSSINTSECGVGPYPPVFSRSVSSQSKMSTPCRPTFSLSANTPLSLSATPPLCSPEDDSDIMSDCSIAVKKISQPASSGYGSAGSESDQDTSEQMTCSFTDDSPTNRVSRINRTHKTKQEREAEKWRRRSVPASLRNAFTDDVMKILQKDGHVNYETHADTGIHLAMEVRGVNRPESVMQLARRFGEISAAQQNDLHKSRSCLIEGKENTRNENKSKSGPTTPIRQVRPYQDSSLGVGGIASLTTSNMASRPNMFKQMEKVGSNTSSSTMPARALNPNSVKDALLRWVQNRLQDYPIDVKNFSSSWNDGMAFCALIHRFAPNSFDYYALDPRNRAYNFDLAFKVAEANGIWPLLEVEDMITMGDRPDWKCVFTYVQTFYKAFRDRP